MLYFKLSFHFWSFFIMSWIYFIMIQPRKRIKTQKIHLTLTTWHLLSMCLMKFQRIFICETSSFCGKSSLKTAEQSLCLANGLVETLCVFEHLKSCSWYLALFWWMISTRRHSISSLSYGVSQSTHNHWPFEREEKRIPAISRSSRLQFCSCGENILPSHFRYLHEIVISHKNLSLYINYIQHKIHHSR